MRSFIVANLGVEKVFKIDKGHTVSLASIRGSYYLIKMFWFIKLLWTQMVILVHLTPLGTLNYFVVVGVFLYWMCCLNYISETEGWIHLS